MMRSGHVGNLVPPYGPQSVCDVGIEGNNSECRILAAQFAGELIKSVGRNASTLHQVYDFNQRDRRNVCWSAAGGAID
jgi:hypothetical protein